MAFSGSNLGNTFDKFSYMGYSPEEEAKRRINEEIADRETAAQASLERTVEADPAEQEKADRQRWKDMTRGQKAGMLLDALSTGLAAAASNNPGQTAAHLLNSKLQARMAEREAKRREKQAALDRAHQSKEKGLDRSATANLQEDRLSAGAEQAKLDREHQTNLQEADFAGRLDLQDDQQAAAALRQKTELTTREKMQLADIENTLYQTYFKALEQLEGVDAGEAMVIATALREQIPLSPAQQAVLDRASNIETERSAMQKAEHYSLLDARRTQAHVALSGAPQGQMADGTYIPTGVDEAGRRMAHFGTGSGEFDLSGGEVPTAPVTQEVVTASLDALLAEEPGMTRDEIIQVFTEKAPETPRELVVTAIIEREKARKPSPFWEAFDEMISKPMGDSTSTLQDAIREDPTKARTGRYF